MYKKVFAIFLSLATAIIFHVAVGMAASKNNNSGCYKKKFTYSGVYAPYRTYEIRSKIAGEVTNIWFREGNIIPAGSRFLTLDASLEQKQLANYQALKKTLNKEEVLLKNIVAIKNKDYERYKRLFKAGQVSEQALDNKKLALINAQDSLIKIQKEKIQVENSIAALSDHIKKASFAFDKDLYVSQLFVEQYEQVNPGSLLAKLLDISQARITLVTPPRVFKALEERIKSDSSVTIPVKISEDSWQPVEAKIEKVKLDPANDYLYSYSFDLVLSPLEHILWGEVVTVDLGTILNQAGHEQ